MKTIKRIATLTLIAVFTVSVFSFCGCAKAGIGGPSYTIDGDADGAQVIPASGSTATGSITGIFDGNDNTMKGTISWEGLSGKPTAIHIHNGKAGKNGYASFVMVDIPNKQTGELTFTSSFTEAQEGEVSKNNYYFDIHTAAYPDGEIRGQIIAH